jgi:hypothetical protein
LYCYAKASTDAVVDTTKKTHKNMRMMTARTKGALLEAGGCTG